MSDPVRWLSQVCEVITDPSADASFPTMIEVQACDFPTGERQHHSPVITATTAAMRLKALSLKADPIPQPDHKI